MIQFQVEMATVCNYSSTMTINYGFGIARIDSYFILWLFIERNGTEKLICFDSDKNLNMIWILNAE